MKTSSEAKLDETNSKTHQHLLGMELLHVAPLVSPYRIHACITHLRVEVAEETYPAFP
jgi:hypothetical protein